MDLVFLSSIMKSNATGAWMPAFAGLTATKRPGFPGRLHEAIAKLPQRMFEATKSQFTRFQNASTYFGRALR